MRRILRQVHLWIGLALCLLMLLFAVTGGALVYKEAYWRTVYPELRADPPVVTAAGHAAAIAAARAEFGDDISVKLPEPGVAAYHLYLDDGEAFLSIGDHRVIDQWRPRERVMSWLFDLHAHLMAGETGEKVGGVVSLLGVLLAVTGLVLWWPSRRRFTLRNMIPRNVSRRSLLLWHRDLGALTSPILLIVLLTGSGIVFYSTAQRILNGMFGDAVPTAAAADAPAVPNARTDAALIEKVGALFPDARIVFYYPPTATSGVHGFRLKQPCELHPNGRSYVYLSTTGDVLQQTNACVSPPGERATHALYPLHAGKTDSGVYKALVLLSAVVLAALSVSGAVTYGQGLQRTLTRSHEGTKETATTTTTATPTTTTG